MNIYAFSVGSVALIIKLYFDYYQAKDLGRTLEELREDSSLPRPREFDFIVVGGGGAGAVMANRLSKFHTVLLLEAGGDPVPATDTLLYYYTTLSNALLNYIYTSVPQAKASQSTGGVITFTQGKMMGGSTSHNGLLFNRGNPSDFQRWARLTKDPSWEYRNVLKYFQKLEAYIGEYDSLGGRAQHGLVGPMTVDTLLTPLESSWLKAGAELGFKRRLDSNGPQEEEFVAVSTMQRKGHRVSTYNAYIKPIVKLRKTLKIERYSTVTKILVNKENMRSYGVAYYRHGIPQLAYAVKEIIVSCGSLGTPLLLMRSGIGPVNVLKEAKIPLIKEAPVGVGLVDHPGVTLFPVMLDPATNSSFADIIKDFTEESLARWQYSGTGPLAALGAQGQSFIVSSRAKRENQPAWPDIQFQIGEGLPPANYEALNTTQPVYWLAIIVTRPKSSGVVSLNTTAYRAGVEKEELLTLIDYKLLSESTDADVLFEGIKLAARVIYNTTEFRKFGTQFIDPGVPGCSNYSFQSDEYWKCYIKETATINYHITSSCRMGYGSKDKKAVLDSKLNVLGVEGLKVVDASIMPIGPNANPTAAVIMIAEKTADEILTHWNNKVQIPKSFAVSSLGLDPPYETLNSGNDSANV